MSYYETMLENLKAYYPSVFNNMNYSYRSGIHEITIVENNGDRQIYSDATNSICYIPNRLGELSSDDEWLRDFSKKLNRLMTDRGITQKDLSELTGISQPMISYYLNGRRAPSLHNARRLAVALKCSISDLCDF